MTVLTLCLSAFSSFAQEKCVGTNDQFKGPVGLQIYSLRNTFNENVELGMEITENLGFHYVEIDNTHGMEPEEFLKLLEKHHLKPVSAHWDFNMFDKNPEQVIKEAKALGLEYAGVAWLPHEGDFDEAECRKAIEVFNRAGELFAKEGIKIFLHNHGYEFQPYGDKGETLFDLFVQETNPETVFLQMDVLWTVFPGQDPVALLKKYPNRFVTFHLKDLKKGVEGDLSGGTSVENDVALGTGQVNYPELLKTAQECGVRYYFIEDESPVVLTQLPQSLKYLESVHWEE